MKLTVSREHLLKPLQRIIGAVERRQTMPALSNILLRTEADGVSMTATDLEVELVAHLDTMPAEAGETTIPARKLLDICRTLPEGAQLLIEVANDKAVITSDRSRFTLMTLPANEFPVVEEFKGSQTLTIPQSQLKTLIEQTAFAMAQQDVRYYLNGLMLEIDNGTLRTVATDGHRLSLYELDEAVAEKGVSQQVIIPRKGVQELLRLLEDNDEDARIELTSNHIRVSLPEMRFTSKLIDGRFPDYHRVLPSDTDKTVRLDRNAFRQALTRASILSNEKYRGIRLIHTPDSLRIQAHNPEQEEAEEEIEIDYSGELLEIGFNVSYLLDVLSTLGSQQVEIQLKDANSSALLKAPDSDQARYVVMPMRL